MSTEIQVREAGTPPETVGNPAEKGSLVWFAIERGVDAATLERLVALQERIVDRSAEQAMVEALVGFQGDCPPVPRTRVAEVKKNGVKQYEYRFAPLEAIVAVIRPHLMKHGLSYTHDAEVSNDRVRVTCVLQHIDGARRSSTFECPFDSSGGKNPIQAVGSARSYGRRYTLCDVLGLTTDEDDDGRAGGGPEPETITEQQVADLEALIEEVRASKTKVLAYAKADALAAIPAGMYPQVVRILEDMRAR